jgi:exosortase/archaeosortase family protein
MQSFLNKQILLYLVKFIGIFCLLYFGTLAVEGLAAPEGKYFSSFVDNYLDYVSWLRSSLLYGSKFALTLLGYPVNIPDAYSLKLVDGAAVHIGYDCIGYGVLSFWLAFIMANTGSLLKKTAWIIGGSIVIWLVNMLRICLFLLSLNKKQQMPFGLDNHTFFNITAYMAIFIMIFFYDRSFKEKKTTTR